MTTPTQDAIEAAAKAIKGVMVEDRHRFGTDKVYVNAARAAAPYLIAGERQQREAAEQLAAYRLDAIKSVRGQVDTLSDRANAAESRLATVTAALKGVLGLYVSVVNSGDAGWWDAEKDLEVIAARAALKEEV